MFFSFELYSKEIEEEGREVIVVVGTEHKREKKEPCNDIGRSCVIDVVVEALWCKEGIACRRFGNRKGEE